MKKLKYLLISLMLILPLSGCGTNSSGSIAGTLPYQIPEGFEIIQQLKEDLDNDKQTEAIYLLASEANEAGFADKKLVVVTDKRICEQDLTNDEQRAFFTELKLLDLDGDKVKELVLLTDPHGNGGKGIKFLSVSTFSKFSLNYVPLHTEPKEASWKLTFQAPRSYQITNTQTQRTWSFTIKDPDYPGSVKPDSINPWLDTEYEFNFIDTNGDGKTEVIARQIICGMAHVDIIGELETTYQLRNNKLVPIEYKAYHEDKEIKAGA